MVLLGRALPPGRVMSRLRHSRQQVSMSLSEVSHHDKISVSVFIVIVAADPAAAVIVVVVVLVVVVVVKIEVTTSTQSSEHQVSAFMEGQSTVPKKRRVERTQCTHCEKLIGKWAGYLIVGPFVVRLLFFVRGQHFVAHGRKSSETKGRKASGSLNFKVTGCRNFRSCLLPVW